MDNVVEIGEDFIKRARHLGFTQLKRRLDADLNRDDKAGRTQAAEGGFEQILVFVS